MTLKRCSWCGDDPLYVRYHDEEWGIPLHDDQKLFELLMLECAQAGLSWITVLRKRENYRAAFDNFDPQKMLRYDQKKIESLLANPGIVRNRLKVQSAITNARAYLDIVEAYGSFDQFVWQFVDGKPIRNKVRSIADIQASTLQSDRMSKELKKCGFKFVGSTICYAFMQASGMVNDHLTTCFRYKQM